MYGDRGAIYHYNGDQNTTHKCIELICCTSKIYNVIYRIYFNKKNWESSSINIIDWNLLIIALVTSPSLGVTDS